VRVALVAALALGLLACSSSSARPRRPDYGTVSDGGLSAPPPSSKNGVIVPSDMGVGPGTPGPQSVTPPTPASGAPGMINN
jgi:hypothetical protein